MNDKEKSKQVDRILSKLEPEFRQAFLTAVQDIQSAVSLAELERAINQGDYNSIFNDIDELLEFGAFFAFTRAIQNTIQAGGDIAHLWAKQDMGFLHRLLVTENITANLITSYQSTRIREISDSIKGSIQRAVMQGYYANKSPKQIARSIKKMIGITYKQQVYIDNYEKELREGSAEALERKLRDKRYDRAVTGAISGKKKLTEKQIENIVTKYREKFVIHRAEVIARTESIRLFNIGQREYWEQAQRSGKIYRDNIKRFWIPTYDGKLREAHRSIPIMNKEGVGFDEPFSSPLGNIMFPGDPNATAGNTVNCRCSLRHEIVGG